MKNLINLKTEQIMTLKEITDLLEVRHDNAMRTVAGMVGGDGFGASPQIEESYNLPNGGTKRLKTYQLDKRQSIAVASRLNVSFLMRIVDRWQELENNKPQLPDFNNPAAAARAWADNHEALQLEQQKTAELSTALDKEFGYCSILRAARFLGVSEKVFNWRPLKAESLRIGYPAKKAPSPRYGYQNLYPLQAFKTCYPDYDFSDLTPDSTNLTPLTF